MSGSRNSEEGSALLFVLWASVLLSVLLVGAVALTHQQVRLAASARDRAQSGAVLRSALELAAYDVATIGRAASRDFPREFAIQGRRVRVEINPAGAVFDINLVDESRLVELLTRRGQEAPQARTMAQRVLDWRDNDDRRRGFGAERGDYPTEWAGGPENRPFIAVSELQGVLGMSPRLMACLAPSLTVFGSTPPAEDADIVRDLSARADGLRLAMRARFVEETANQEGLYGVALFGPQHGRPFRWVALTREQRATGQCDAAEGVQ